MQENEFAPLRRVVACRAHTTVFVTRSSPASARARCLISGEQLSFGFLVNSLDLRVVLDDGGGGGAALLFATEFIGGASRRAYTYVRARALRFCASKTFRRIAFGAMLFYPSRARCTSEPPAAPRRVCVFAERQRQ